MSEIIIQGFGGALPVDPFAVMNTIGLVAFALVGSTKEIREEFDLFGVAVVGLAMAFAGEATRDISRIAFRWYSNHQLRSVSEYSVWDWRSD